MDAIGVREALSWLKDQCWSNAQVETDCLVVVQAIRSISVSYIFLLICVTV